MKRERHPEPGPWKYYASIGFKGGEPYVYVDRQRTVGPGAKGPPRDTVTVEVGPVGAKPRRWPREEFWEESGFWFPTIEAALAALRAEIAANLERETRKYAAQLAAIDAYTPPDGAGRG
jgi:hypothetical protein